MPTLAQAVATYEAQLNTVVATFVAANATASDAATAADAAKSAAALSATQAGQSAGTASTAASTATNKATEAGSSASTASSGAVIAANQAVIATNKATESATSAVNAAASASAATTKANEAAVSATAANTKASESLSSAQTATTQASASTTGAATSTSAATAASTSASQANTSAGTAGASSAQALAIFGTTAVMNAALATAASQSSAAQTAASSASSVLQQDLSAISAALHRSPNAVTAMTIYDTSKDSDGGAWVDRMQDKSWANEPLNGAWLGNFENEVAARGFAGSNASPELVANGAFSVDTAGWVAFNGGTLSVVAGSMRLTQVTANGGAQQSITTVAGRTYEVTMSTIATSANHALVISTTSGITGNLGGSGNLSGVGAKRCAFTATGAISWIAIAHYGPGTTTLDVDNISTKEVNTAIDVTGRYYQLTTDGKFYRLNTSTGVAEVFRGNKAKFPRLAAIVAEGGNVTIYDLTEPGRPMWMRFAGGQFRPCYSAGTSSLSTSNGKIVIGCADASFGILSVVDFLLDSWVAYRALASQSGGYRAISTRNNTRTAVDYTPAGAAIVNNQVNAVAITVLPDAPIDVVTGLPVPTIAVATAGGVSVIRQDGTVANHTFTGDLSDAVAFSGVRLLYGSATLVAGPRAIRVADITGSSFVGAVIVLVATGIASNNLAPSRTEGLVAVRQPIGLGRLIQFRLNYASLSLSLRADIASTHNTGWMIGDVRRAYMADTVVGSLTAPELFAGFPTMVAANANGTVVTSSTNVVCTCTVAGVYGARPNGLGVSAGITYQITVGWSGNINGRNIGYDFGNSGAVLGTAVSGTNTRTLTPAVGGSIALYATNGLVGETLTFSVLSVKEASPDRSYKAATASINGTIVKSAVASAAQLVTFSGWSALNYLQEPYSADLDYGVGDFRLSAWVNYLPTRRNLLLNSEGDLFVPNAGAGSAITKSLLGSGVSRLVKTGTGGFAETFVVIPATASVAVTSNNSVEVRLITGNPQNISFGSSQSETPFAKSTQTLLSLGVSSADGVWRRINFATTVTPTPNANLRVVYFAFDLNADNAIELRFPQVDLGSTATTYQRVNTATDYDGYNATIAERSAASGPSFRLGIQGDRLIATVFDGTTTRTVTSTDSYATGIFAKASVNYVSGRLAINVNGVEVASANGVPLLTMNSASPRHNLLTKTEQFDDAVWPKSDVAVVANAAVDPVGTNTADKLNSSAVLANHLLNAANLFSVVAGQSFAFSMYAKASEYGFIRLQFQQTAFPETWANFNLTTGVVGLTTGTPVASIVAVGGGWYRCSITSTATNTNTSGVQPFVLDADRGTGSPTYAGVATSGIFIWGAQLEVGTTVTTYQRVNTVSDYDTTVAVRASLTIGNSRALDAPFPGSLTLVRTGATVPTPEQAWWMFDQERRMFQSGAQITLPVSTAVSDLVYDDQQDKWVASQPTFESSFTGLIRTASAAPSAGTFNKVSATNGVKLSSRAATLPGVDVTVPPYGLREELVRRAEAAAKATRPIAALNRDAIGFTATTTSASSALTAVSVTSGVPYIGMVVSGTGIPAGTRIIGINGTIYYLNANATATATAVAIGQTSFILPVGFTVVEVMTAGNSRQEGSTKDYTRTFDGFAETVQFAVSPGSGAWCQFIIRKELV